MMSHTMKIWERIIESRVNNRAEISKQQYKFQPEKRITDAMFALRMLMEKYRKGQRELHFVFMDLEKAYDKVPTEFNLLLPGLFFPQPKRMYCLPITTIMLFINLRATAIIGT